MLEVSGGRSQENFELRPEDASQFVVDSGDTIPNS